MNLKLIGDLLETYGIEANTIILILIFLVCCSGLFFIAKGYFKFVSAYTDYLLKQKDCDGKFNGLGIEITHIKETANKADERSTKNKESIDRMEPKIDDIHGWWEDKYKRGVILDG